MGPDKKDVIIIGEGITGLTIAHWLRKRGVSFTLLARQSAAGGTMQTVRDSGFLLETGPNTALETTPLFKELVGDLELEREFVYANPVGKNRYILKNGALVPLPLSPGAFLRTPLFSPGAKFRVLGEPFAGRATEEESIAQFVRRRLGREFLDYAIDPFVAGVFAGKAERLSVRSAFPKLYALEENYGGLVKGMILGGRERKRRAEKAKDRAETFSFLSGMQTLPAAIAARLGKAVVFDARATGIRDLAKERGGNADEPGQRRYLVEYLHRGKEEEVEGDAVVFAVPAFEAATILKPLSSAVAGTLNSIYYPPVISLFLGFRREDIRHPLDGFGYLIPSVEKRRILGCLWTSSLFPERAPRGMVALNTFIGGARQPELTAYSDDEAIAVALEEMRSPMQIQGKPVYLHVTRWSKAIPQYEVGYSRKIDEIVQFEEEFPGIVLAGNYRGGISVGDCVKTSYEHAETVSRIVDSGRTLA